MISHTYVQVIGSLALVNIDWPEQLNDTLTWFSGLNLEIAQLPLLACVFADGSFLQQVLGYAAD